MTADPAEAVDGAEREQRPPDASQPAVLGEIGADKRAHERGGCRIGPVHANHITTGLAPWRGVVIKHPISLRCLLRGGQTSPWAVRPAGQGKLSEGVPDCRRDAAGSSGVREGAGVG